MTTSGKAPRRNAMTGVPAAFTQLWANNNNGKVIGATSNDPTAAVGVFYFVYDPATGAFTPITPPPGVDPSLVAAIQHGGCGSCTGFGVTMRRGKSRYFP